MLTSVQFHNPLGSVLEIPMNDSTEYLIKGITGLGPVKADILTTEYVNVPGGEYQGIKENQRELVFLMGYNPSYLTSDPIGTLRRGLYPWLLPGRAVDVYFISDNLETLKTTGYVEDFLPTMFTEDPEVQISILCPDPALYSLIEQDVNLAAYSSAWFTVNNPGSFPVGFKLLMKHLRNDMYSNFNIVRELPIASEMVYFASRTASWPYTYYTIEVSTIPGGKYSRNMLYEDWIDNQSGTWESSLGFLTGWFLLEPGDNKMKIEIAYFNFADLTLSFTPKYAGL